MDQNYEMALSEVDEILNYTDEELVKKILIQLRILISNNKNKEYKPNIDRTRQISEQELLKETKAILSLLFRSYWATEEEKLEFEKQDALEYENLSNTRIEQSHKDLKIKEELKESNTINEAKEELKKELNFISS